MAKWPLAIGVPALVLSVSLFVFHYPTISSKFAIIQGDFGDNMILNYALEHEYRWVTGNQLDHSFWSPPIFYPQHDTAAYTELMLGSLPAYAVWRLFGVAPLTAFQLWVITVSALNFLSAWWLLRSVLACGWIGATGGSLLLSFGSPRMMELGHVQLLPDFYMIVAFAGLCMLFARAPGELTSRQVYTGLLLFLGGFCLQLHTSFYNAWFMVFTSALGLVFAFLLPDSRSRLLCFLERWWKPLLSATLLAALAIAPYMSVAFTIFRQVGGRSYSEVRMYLPSLKSWLAQGPNHLLYGGLNRLAGVGPNYGSKEMFEGIGLFTTALVIAGFVLFRQRTILRLWSLVAFSVIILSYQFPRGFSLWHAGLQLLSWSFRRSLCEPDRRVPLAARVHRAGFYAGPYRRALLTSRHALYSCRRTGTGREFARYSQPHQG